MSQQWPIPKDQVQLDSLYCMTPITEVDRREEYLSCCNPDVLKQLVKMCLNNNPNHRPNTSDVCAELKKIRASIENQVPLAKANAVELLDAVQQSEVQIELLKNKIKAQIDIVEGKLSEQEQQLVQLHVTSEQQNSGLEQR